jgi:hypothetical protein
MRAFTLATTRYAFETYSLVVGFGVTSHDDVLNIDLDTVSSLQLRVFVADSCGRSTAATRPKITWVDGAQETLMIEHRKRPPTTTLFKVARVQNKDIIQACVASLRSCVGRDGNELAEYVVTCVSPESFDEVHAREVAEAARNMSLLPITEVGYRLDDLSITFNLGRVWFPDPEAAVVD